MVEPLELARLKVSYICDVCKFTSKDSSVIISHSGTHLRCKEALGIALEEKINPRTKDVMKYGENVQKNDDCNSPRVGKHSLNAPSTSCDVTMEGCEITKNGCEQHTMSGLDQKEDLNINSAKLNTNVNMQSEEGAQFKVVTEERITTVNSSVTIEEDTVQANVIVAPNNNDNVQSIEGDHCEMLIEERITTVDSPVTSDQDTDDEQALPNNTTSKSKENKQMGIQNKELNSYACRDCGKNYKCERLFNKHTCSHSISELTGNPCKLETKISQLRQQQKHALLKGTIWENMKTHADNGYPCVKCGKFIKGSLNNLRIHMRRHTGERPYECDICDASFIDPTLLKQHRISHGTKVKPWPCDICGKSFLYNSALERHKTIHKRIKNIPCIIGNCKFRTKNRNSLLMHLRNMHESDKSAHQYVKQRRKYVLHQHKSVRKSVLTQHKSVRNQESNNVIETNDSKSKSQANTRLEQEFDDDISENEDDEPEYVKLIETSNQKQKLTQQRKPVLCNQHLSVWKCFLCDESFNFVVQLRGHLTNSHPEYKPIQCPLCNFRTKRPYRLSRHLEKHHSLNSTDTSQGSWSCCNFENLSRTQYHNHLKYDHRMDNQNSTDDATKVGTVMDCSNVPIDQMDRSEMNSFTCEDCGKNYKCKRLFNKHTCNSTGLASTQTSRQPEQESNDDIETNDSKGAPKLQRNAKLEQEFEDDIDSNKSSENEDDNPEHECDICEQIFNQKHKLVEHKRKFHCEGGIECEVCQNIVFGGRKSYIRHVAKHSGKQYTCDDCGKGFHDKYAMQFHTLIHKKNSENFYQCDECEFVCAKIADFRQHKHKHHRKQYESWKGVPIDKYGHQCETCGTFIRGSYSNLLKHVRRHTGERPYECDICQASFIEPTLLKQHKITHSSNVKPCLCEYCGKSFFNNSALSRHKTIHKDLRDFPCDIDECDYQAKSRNSLQIHKRRFHMKDKRYHCHFCDICYFSDSERNKHELDRHKTVWKCFVCGDGFDYLIKMRSHLSKSHPEYKPIHCQLCDFNTKRPYLLSRHLKKHHSTTIFQGSWSCVYCNVENLSKRQYWDHLKDDHRMESFIDGAENQMGEPSIVNHLSEDNQAASLITEESTVACTQGQLIQNEHHIDQQESTVACTQGQLIQNEHHIVQQDAPTIDMDSVQQPVMFVIVAPNTNDGNMQREEGGVCEVVLDETITTMDSSVTSSLDEDTVQSIGVIVEPKNNDNEQRIESEMLIEVTTTTGTIVEDTVQANVGAVVVIDTSK